MNLTPRKQHSLLNSLLAMKIDGKTPDAFIVDDTLKVSAENGDGLVEYYHPQGWPYIHPKLEAWATRKGGFFEWCNPGCIGFYL